MLTYSRPVIGIPAVDSIQPVQASTYFNSQRFLRGKNQNKVSDKSFKEILDETVKKSYS